MFLSGLPFSALSFYCFSAGIRKSQKPTLHPQVPPTLPTNSTSQKQHPQSTGPAQLNSLGIQLVSRVRLVLSRGTRKQKYRRLRKERQGMGRVIAGDLYCRAIHRRTERGRWLGMLWLDMMPLRRDRLQGGGIYPAGRRWSKYRSKWSAWNYQRKMLGHHLRRDRWHDGVYWLHLGPACGRFEITSRVCF